MLFRSVETWLIIRDLYQLTNKKKSFLIGTCMFY